MATINVNKASSQINKGSGISLSFKRITSNPLDVSATWPDMETLIAYAMNDGDDNCCPYEGQILSCKGKIFVLREVNQLPYTYKFTTIDAQGQEIQQEHIVSSWVKTSRKHFTPIEHQSGSTEIPDMSGKDISVGSMAVTGNETVGGNISVSGNSTVTGTSTIGSGTTTTVINKNTVTTGTVNTGDVTATSTIKAGSGTNTTTINGGTINTNAINIGTTGSLSVTDGQSILNVDSVVTDKIVARLAEASKTTYVGGRQIVSKGCGCKVKSVTKVGNNYKCTLQLETEAGNISNPFILDDCLICQNYGSNQQRAYWRRVIAVDSTSVTLSGSDTNANYVNPNMKDAPLEGDTLCQLGYAGSDAANADRTYAIVSSAVVSTELPGVSAPYLAMWTNIVKPAWPAQPSHLFSRTKNIIKGDLYTTAGENIATSISSLQESSETYGADLEKVMEQMDSSYQIWFCETTPTLSNYPASEFGDELDEHIEDICYDTNENDDNYGKAWRFRKINGVYTWENIQDPSILDALSKATAANATSIEAKGIATEAKNKAVEIDSKWSVTRDKFEAITGLFVDGELTSGSTLTLTQNFAQLFTQSMGTGGTLNSAGLVTTSNSASIIAEHINNNTTVKAAIEAVVNGSESNINITATKINMNGYVSGNNSWSIDANGTAKFQGGEIGGWIIKQNAITKTFTTKETINGVETDVNRNITLTSLGYIFCSEGVFGVDANPYTASWGLFQDGSGRMAKGYFQWSDSGKIFLGFTDAEIADIQNPAADDANKAEKDAQNAATIAIKGDVYASGGKIGGWTIGTSSITKGNVSLGADGTISNGNNWKFQNDGYGQLASGKIKWDANGTKIGGVTIQDAYLRAEKVVDGKKNQVVIDASNAQIFSAIYEEGQTTKYPWTLRGDGTFSMAYGNLTYNGTDMTINGCIYANKLYARKNGTGDYVDVLEKNIQAQDGDVLQITNLKAVNGDFEGVVKASAFYLKQYVVADDDTTNITLNPNTDKSTLLCGMFGKTITLPNAADYPGLEYTFVGAKTITRSTIAPVVIKIDQTKSNRIYLGADERVENSYTNYDGLCISCYFHSGIVKLMSDGVDWVLVCVTDGVSVASIQ